MSVSDAVFQLFIEPLRLIYEFIFYYAIQFTGSIGAAVILLGLVMNFMLLPLYRQADAIQNEEREQEKKMEHWLSHIKKTFSGNERFMMTQTYYRQNNYKPWYSLRGMMPLLLEVPFFIAAYNYLSGLDSLSVPFGPISDLSKPDGLIYISGVSINLLPIVMTVINIISGAVYTKGLKLKDKIQLYGMAALFLVLLYDSPSGLVLYWTVNNLFSLVKNIINILKNPRRASAITISALGAAAAVWAFVMPVQDFSARMPMIDLALLMQLPLVIYFIKDKLTFSRFNFKERKPDFMIFFTGCIFMTLLTGLLIPSAVVASSPVEFVSFSDFRSPLFNVLSSFLLAAGMFIIWPCLFYYLSGKGIKNTAAAVIWCFSVIAVIDYMFFGTETSRITDQLRYEGQKLSFKPLSIILNIAAVAAAAALTIFIYKKSRRTIKIIYAALCIAVICMSGMNIIKIKAADPEIQTAYETTKSGKAEFSEGSKQIIHLSRNNKNVIVLMMDRAVNCYIPYIFAEKPELKEKFSGFTYYPNTLSYGPCTNYAAPALFGGYEYTPDEINKRSDESLADKHNESLKVMPVLFYENDYDVTVIEPPYAGYSWIPDLSIYNDYPDMQTYNVEQGQMLTDDFSNQFISRNDLWKRNIFCYSIMKIMPCVLQTFVYHDGDYYISSNSAKFIDINYEFMESYAVLNALPSLTAGEQTERSTFLMMSNCTTHEIQALQEPDYEPSLFVDNTAYDKTHQDRFTVDGRTIHMDDDKQILYYQVNMAAMLKLGEWLDHLRELGVYDNTRIIIVADHGSYNLRHFDDMLKEDDGYEDFLSYNPLLLVKDFGSSGFTTDNSFMTNADVPSIAFNNLIKDPVNPFTGKEINSEAKQGEQLVMVSLDWDTSTNKGNTFKPGQWYTVHDDIFDLSNWKKSGWH